MRLTIIDNNGNFKNCIICKSPHFSNGTVLIGERMEKRRINKMKIIVRKPTAEEIAFMKTQPIWTCGVSEFDWAYDSEENCLLLEGKVTVTYDGGEASFGVGDYVIFPQGLKCVWKVSQPVKKHYIFK